MSQYEMCGFFFGNLWGKIDGGMFGLWSKMLCGVAVRVGNMMGGVGVENRVGRGKKKERGYEELKKGKA